MNFSNLKADIYNTSNPENQIKAAHAMRYAREKEAEFILLDCSYQAEEFKLRKTAIDSLTVKCPFLALNAYKKSTLHRNPDRRIRAYENLGFLGRKEGLQSVLDGLTDPDAMVRRIAAISAGRLGKQPSVITALQRLTSQYEPEPVRFAANKSIQKIKQKLNGGFKDKKSGSFDNNQRQQPRKSLNAKPHNRHFNNVNSDNIIYQKAF